MQLRDAGQLLVPGRGPQLLTRDARFLRAHKHCKAMRRYQQAIESGRLNGCAAESFGFLGVGPLYNRIVYAPDSPLLMMGQLLLRSSIAISGGTGGAAEWGGETPNRWVAFDATGTDNGQSINAPWTMAQAMASGSAGHIIGQLAGSGSGYTGSNTGSNSIPAFYFANDGSSGSHIKMVARWCSVYHVSNRSQLSNGITSGNGSTPGSACPTFGAYQNAYVDWIGQYVDEDVSRSLSDTGPVVINASNNCSIQKTLIACVTIDRNDNHNGVRVESASDCVVEDVRVTGCKRSDQIDQNYAAFMCYDSERITFRYIETDDCDVGFFPKGVHVGNLGGIVIQQTKNTNIHWCGIRLGGVGTTTTDRNEVYDNLVVAGTSDANLPIGIELKAFDAISPKLYSVVYNTIVGFAQSLRVTHAGGGSDTSHTTSNIDHNIHSGATQVGHCIAADATARAQMVTVGFTMDDEHIYDCTNIGNINGFYEDVSAGDRSATMSAWRTATTYDDNSTEGDPLYVNAAGGDYSLQGGSPASGKGFRVTPGVRAG